uniref:Uncharacterized protein n=1 Tax=Spongospora subterranea TaxID=70186 RepID=A0A0H5RDW5_9EUKA|eukprot:CRZ12435.1 hypothetical protein [Spongospora subterranea]
MLFRFAVDCGRSNHQPDYHSGTRLLLITFGPILNLPHQTNHDPVEDPSFLPPADCFQHVFADCSRLGQEEITLICWQQGIEVPLNHSRYPHCRIAPNIHC